MSTGMGNASAVPPPVPAPAPVFALGPGHGNTILDYSNPSHVKAYYKVTTPFIQQAQWETNSPPCFLAECIKLHQEFWMEQHSTYSRSPRDYQKLSSMNMVYSPLKKYRIMPRPIGSTSMYMMHKNWKCYIISCFSHWKMLSRPLFG